MVEHRSVSQLNSYERCPHAYYLARVKKVWQRPAAWLAQGTAFHAVAEKKVKADLEGTPLTTVQSKAMFTDVYVTTINDQLEVTPNFQYWFRSGPYDGQIDIVRRHQIGLEQIERFHRYLESHPEDVFWIAPDGTYGCELGFDIDLDGVKIKGYIDAVLDSGDPGVGVIVRDWKTGNTPGDDFQLGTYGVALAEQFGIKPPLIGEYWMARTGKPTRPYDLSEWTRDAVAEKFHQLDENIRAGRFDPRPDSDKCRFCDVAWACEYAV